MKEVVYRISFIQSTADTQISALRLNCQEDGVVQISNTQHSRGNMQLLRGGQLTEADQPNQQPPLPATPSQINVHHFHQLSRATADTQDSSLGLDCQDDVVQISNSQHSDGNRQLLSRAGQLKEGYPPNQRPL
ncbi:uncharacterized protein LOC124197458 isoform X3 [Daphnia pulex]|uniref:uncharacterized protein LOC124197293 isoform X2 n=1 Tax=Daphnia pulex TaxID=6669 RepID=UPI001EDF5C73|nr:uncharacterized protein LOC124197293 isoform X2 [Daphnia pulex]XP_046449055.1 uncharacterized protein LOC124197458 isoform X3 [Daphnia pulex]